MGEADFEVLVLGAGSSGCSRALRVTPPVQGVGCGSVLVLPRSVALADEAPLVRVRPTHHQAPGEDHLALAGQTQHARS